MSKQPEPVTLFLSYAHEDESLRAELETHLSLLQRQGLLSTWQDRRIMAGTDWAKAIDEHLNRASIILLLVSANFLASNYCYGVEMQRALDRDKAGQARVIPILLRPVDWEQTPLAHLQAIPRNGRPVTMWRNRDLAFVNIAQEIRSLLEQWSDPSGRSFPVSTRSARSLPPSPFVFLSSARADLATVTRLTDELRAQDIVVWGDHDALPAGDPDREEALRQAIRSAVAVVFVASPDARSSRYVKDELRIAEMYKHPIYPFWIAGTQWMEAVPLGWGDMQPIDARPERYMHGRDELIAVLRKQTTAPTVSVPSAPEEMPSVAPPRNPYKGLAAFRSQDAGDFFGRARLIQELIQAVQQLLVPDPHGTMRPRLLTVMGPSGSGKSSVIMAGLLPQLQQGVLPESRSWIYLNPMAPGQHPLETLGVNLSPLFPERSLVSLREDLEADSARGLHLLLTTCVKHANEYVLLIVDQFEEVFTQTTTEDERRHFLDLLLTAVTEPQGSVIVILTLRADFYDRPLAYPELGHLIDTQHMTLLPMELKDIRAVIEQPARLPDVQLTFDEGLVGDLLFDIQGQIGALPLLQFTLDQLFQKQEHRQLTQRAYQEIGGVRGALAQHAEALYHSLPTEAHRRLARALFLRLIDAGTLDQDATKRRVPLSELILADTHETAILTHVTNAFVQARLLTTSALSEIAFIEVSHEMLIWAWKRLTDWLHEAREDLQLRKAINEDALAWNQHGQTGDRLYRDSQLVEALNWKERNIPSRDEDAFLRASVHKQQHVHEQEQQQRRRYTRRVVLVGTAGVLGMIGTGLTIKWLSFFLTKIFSSAVKLLRNQSLLDLISKCLREKNFRKLYLWRQEYKCCY